MIDYLVSVTHNLAVQHQRQPPQLWRNPNLSTQPTLQAPSFLPSPTRYTYTTSSTKIVQNLLFLQSAPSSFTSYSPQFCCSALSYTTLPRRPPAPCWSPREAAARPARDHGDHYDGVGPRTSARGDLPPPPHRGEVGPGTHTVSPPASLGSETLSSYCDPWGQVQFFVFFFIRSLYTHFV